VRTEARNGPSEAATSAIPDIAVASDTERPAQMAILLWLRVDAGDEHYLRQAIQNWLDLIELFP
jgi:hypothetical protein